jgi:hypothetical protein
MAGNLKEPLLDEGFLNRIRRASSEDESVREGYFWANLDSTWTILDQKRLVSLDFLYHRSLEFHNNHHTFRATGDYDYTKDLGQLNFSNVVCEILEFRQERSEDSLSHSLTATVDSLLLHLSSKALIIFHT